MCHACVVERSTMPDDLALKALADGQPYPGAAFLITLPTTKNPMTLGPVGPSDAIGEYHVDGDTLTRRFADATSTDLQGCGALLGDLHVRVANLEDIARCRKGFQLWRSAAAFPDRYLQWLDSIELTLRERVGCRLRAVVAARGGSLRIHGSVQRNETPYA
jgi:hypothetical protein